ncbi:UNVERIFIED_CONTAM: hypothetical protein BEN50_15555 [Euhalothece sp. KZN 001]
MYDPTQAISITAGWDGIHLSAAQHQMLGKALATKIKNIFKSNRGSACLFVENRTARSKDSADV